MSEWRRLNVERSELIYLDIFATHLSGSTDLFTGLPGIPLLVPELRDTTFLSFQARLFF